MGVAYIHVARVGELAAGAMKTVDVGGRQVVVRNIEGEYFAHARECPHEAATLETGDVVGTRLRCEGHSYWFDLRSGECLMPRNGAPLAVLPVEQRDEEICIKLEW